MIPSLDLIFCWNSSQDSGKQLLAFKVHHLTNTMLQDTDELHRKSSGRVPSTGPLPLWSWGASPPHVWVSSPTQKLSKPHIWGGLWRPHHRDDRSLIRYQVLPHFPNSEGWGQNVQASDHGGSFGDQLSPGSCLDAPLDGHLFRTKDGPIPPGDPRGFWSQVSGTGSKITYQNPGGS